MSCIITYKGKQYSEEKFKEYFINNKNEFATSISKNKDVIDSFKRKMEAIDSVFKESPDLAAIGTKAQYMQYLSTIFKTSQVKEIVYHGTPDGRFDSFDINQAGKNTKQSTQGIYFTDSKKTADFYAEGSIDFSQFESLEEYNAVKTAKVFSAILNAKNLKLVDNPQAQDRQGDAVLRTIDKLADNGIVGDIDFAHQYIVFEPEQIYILSSKADIQGFKDYMAFQNSEFAKYGTYEQFRQFIISKSSMQIENRLIETGKIDRVC